ncbi:MAG: hypothetical protein AAFR61_06865 [Bacteroidota bacterium]
MYQTNFPTDSSPDAHPQASSYILVFPSLWEIIPLELLPHT